MAAVPSFADADVPFAISVGLTGLHGGAAKAVRIYNDPGTRSRSSSSDVALRRSSPSACRALSRASVGWSSSLLLLFLAT